MSIAPPPWGFLGLFTGAWKLAIVAAVVVTLYGRAFRPAAARSVASVLGVRATPSPRGTRFNDRAFLFVLVLAATAVASLILGRAWIMQAMSGAEPPRAATRPASRVSAPTDP